MPSAFLTRQGYEELLQELEFLRTVKRQEIAERLREAIEGEDSESEVEAGYDVARQDQAFVEGRIWNLVQLLSNPFVIDECEQGDVVDIGATVTIQENGGDKEVYRIVGAVEASPRNGRISNESPLGKALMGRCPGDEIEVSAPGGTFRVRIIKVN